MHLAGEQALEVTRERIVQHAFAGRRGGRPLACVEGERGAGGAGVVVIGAGGERGAEGGAVGRRGEKSPVAIAQAEEQCAQGGHQAR